MQIAIIGAGVIGVTAALELCGEGHSVTVFDREGVAAGASQGNAGAFAFADIEPLATPGILRQVPRWLLDPDGPLALPPAYLPRMLPWLWRFGMASRPARFRAGTAAQAALMGVSRAALSRLVAAHGLQAELRHEGQLQLYEGAGAFHASRPEWDRRRAAGIGFDLLESPGAIAEIQPGLAPRFTHAGFVPDWTNVVDPARWVRCLAERLVAAGGQIEIAEVAALSPGPDGVEVQAGGAPRRFDAVVLAAGAFSARLLRPLGLRVPLETERGYNTTLPPQSFGLRTQLTFPAHGFVATRIGDGIRIGGAVELGGLDLPPRMSRAEILLRKAATFLPGLRTEGGVQWMGFRPSLPDSLPAIGAFPGLPRLVCAFGHGHLGLTQSPATAVLVADHVAGRAPAIDMTPFAPDRFS